jgi:predicted CoA-substrate-specific enzyme activase
MNDKCAAGTGRFLEMMAHVLGVSLEEFSNLANQSKNKTVINATCSVFAESEVVSLTASGGKKEDIAAGLIDSIAVRIGAMVRRFGIKNEVCFCGGGAKINALHIALSRELAVPITVLTNAQFIVAYGAACV